MQPKSTNKKVLRKVLQDPPSVTPSVTLLRARNSGVTESEKANKNNSQDCYGSVTARKLNNPCNTPLSLLERGLGVTAVTEAPNNGT